MAAVDTTLAEIREATGQTAADGALSATETTALTDDDTSTTTGEKIGKGGIDGDMIRLEFPDLSGLAVDDTMTFYSVGEHNTTEMDLLPYDSAGTPTLTGAINISWGSGANTFTITQAFIDELFDQGGDSFAVRMMNVDWGNGGGGDVQLAEVDADLTAAGAPAVFLPFYRRIANVLLRM